MERSYLWYHVKKCAGTSIKDFLGSSYARVDEVGLPFVVYDEKYWNDVLNDYRVALGAYEFKRVLFAKEHLYNEQTFDDMFKFAIVRNPYDRCVSLWLYYAKYNSIVKRSVSVLGKNKWGYEFFIRAFMVLGFKNSKYRHFSTHSCSAIDDLSDASGKILVDYIGRIEEIKQSMRVIQDELNLPQKSIGHCNTTRSGDSYRQYYNNYTRDIVKHLYAEDIQYFNYKY